MSNNVINPQVAFTDSVGSPRAGGFLHFYTNRTPSYAVVYSDEALTIPQSNPYKLDAYGRVDGDIKFTETLTMKATNADGSDQKTYNDVVAGTSNANAAIDQYKTNPSDPQAMTVTIAAGRTMNDVTLVENAAQTTTTFVAPVTNPRIDRVVINKLTGVYAIIAGSEAASPTAPAITAGNAPSAQVLFATSSSVITSAMITDERISGSIEPSNANTSETLTNKTVTSGIATLDGGFVTARTDSVKLGVSALGNIDTGSARDSTAIGNSALAAATTGTGNSALGSDALLTVSTGSDNSAFGLDALKLSTGSRNTAFGKGALSAATTANDLTAVGNGAAALTTGTLNLAVGSSALGANTTSNRSTAVGAQALQNSTGANNTAIGGTAGSSIVGGINNTCLGANTGDLTTTGSNNTTLGANANPTANSASNEVTLGDSSVSVIRAQVTTITALSDKRDKTNIEDISLGVEFINKLRPVSFDWNMRDGGKKGDPDTGFIAQELKAAQSNGDTLPGLVYESNPERLEAGYGKLLPVMVKAIQELSEKVATLEKKLAQ